MKSLKLLKALAMSNGIKKLLFFSIILFSGFYFLASNTASAATISVCSSGCNYTTIVSAYSAASCGDTIELHVDGHHDETSISLNKTCTISTPITLKMGTGYTGHVINSDIDCGTVVTISGQYNIWEIGIEDVPHCETIKITGDHNTIQNAVFANNGYNDQPAAQTSDTIMIYSSYNTIQNCTFGNSGHGDIDMFDNYGAYTVRYNKILNNVFHDHYGESISFIGGNTQYNLAEGNYITDCGSLCVGGGCASKSCFQISGARNNSIRKNVVFDAYNRAMEISSYSAATVNSTGNWVYNNTFYNITSRTAGAGNFSFITLGTSGGRLNM